MEILNHKIGIGKTVLHLEIAKLHTGTPLDIPVIIQRAHNEGPTLLLLAGIHGNEVNGVEIVRQIIRDNYNIPEVGTVICIPVVNVFGFINNNRDFPDGRDLNRVFPGSKKGSLASRFAYHLMQEIIPHVEYCIDFHTGGDARFNYAQLRVDFEDKKCLELAKVFNTRFILNSPNSNKTFRRAVSSLGKKVLLFEGGKSFDIDKVITSKGIEGCMRVMHHLGLRDFSSEIKKHPIEETILLNSSTWIRSPKAGMFRTYISLGSLVSKGDILASVSDPFGNKERDIKAPNDGFIFCINHSPIVNQGDAVIHISKEK